MSEDERRELERIVSEAHAGLGEIAARLRRRLTLKALVLRAAVQAERAVFRLRCEIERLDPDNPEHSPWRVVLPRVRPGGKAIDTARPGRGKDRGEKP